MTRVRATNRFGAWTRPSALLLVLAAQLSAMTALAIVLGTWQDEEYTLATTAHGVAWAIGRAISYEQQAPLYFALIALLREWAPSPLAARMFSVGCALGFTATIAAIARRVWPAVDPWPLAALAAFNPFVVFAALEIRLYALALLVSALLWLLFYDGFLRGERHAARLAFVVLAIAALYLEYFLAFELVGFAVALMVAGRWRQLCAYVGVGFVCALAFLPLLLVLHTQVTAAFAVPEHRAGPAYGVFLHPLADFLIPYGYGGFPGARALNAALAVCVVGALVAGRPRFDRKLLSLGAVAATVELFYILLVDVLHEELVVPRHFFALFVPETAFAYGVLATLRAPGRLVTGARRTIAVCVAVACVLSLGFTYRAFAKLGDWPRVARWLDVNAGPDDTIAIAEPDAVRAFARYYRGTAKVVAYPRTIDPNVYSVERMMVHSVAEARAAFAALPVKGRLWFVNYDTCDRSDRLGCLEVEAALRQRYCVVERRAFFLTSIERLVLRSGNPVRGRRATSAARCLPA